MNRLSNIPLFFILGRERSGTTMLRVTLDNHPKIHIPPESQFIMHLYKKYYRKDNIDINQFILDLQKEPYLHFWNIDYKDLSKKLKETFPADFQNYCTEILAYHKKNKVLVGDKNPINSLFSSVLYNIFPQAKFIWIVRDYRAQVHSMLKVNFEKKIVSSLASRWVGFNKNIEKLKSNCPNQVLLIKYEDLVHSPEKHYQIICEFLNVEYNSLILNTDKANDEFNSQHHKSLNDKINTQHIDEWKTQLTKKQIKVCEMVAGKYGMKFGYKRLYKANFLITLKVFLGIIYGKAYIPFIRLIYSLPLNVKFIFNQKSNL